MNEVVMTAQHDYMRAGRKLSYPVTSPDETRMELYTVHAPERVSDGNRFKKEESDTVSITKERNIAKAKNAVPYWLKETRKK